MHFLTDVNVSKSSHYDHVFRYQYTILRLFDPPVEVLHWHIQTHFITRYNTIMYEGSNVSCDSIKSDGWMYHRSHYSLWFSYTKLTSPFLFHFLPFFVLNSLVFYILYLSNNILTVSSFLLCLVFNSSKDSYCISCLILYINSLLWQY